MQLGVALRPRGARVSAMVQRKKALNRRGEAMVQEVLGATLEQLAAVGYERLTVPDVAARAGVNKTSVYRRWPTKGALVKEAFETALGEPPEFEETGELRADLMAWGQAAMFFASSPLGLAVFRALLTADAPELRPLAKDLAQATKGPRAVLDRAKKRGELRAGADVELALSAIAGTLLQRLVVERRPPEETLLEDVIDLVLRGLTKR
jgi:AcrR family transcriptional regulator